MGLKDGCRPSGRSFGCAGTTPAARFRHSASIADTGRRSITPISIPAAFAAKLPAVRSEQSVIVIAKRAVAVSVVPSGPVRRHRAGSASAAVGAVLIGPWGCATSCAANTFMPFLQCTGSSLIPWDDDPADNPAGASFSRKPSFASEAKARSGRQLGRARCAAEAMRPALSSSPPARMPF